MVRTKQTALIMAFMRSRPRGSYLQVQIPSLLVSNALNKNSTNVRGLAFNFPPQHANWC